MLGRFQPVSVGSVCFCVCLCVCVSVCLSVRPSVTSRSSIETDERIELIFGTWVSSFEFDLSYSVYTEIRVSAK